VLEIAFRARLLLEPPTLCSSWLTMLPMKVYNFSTSMMFGKGLFYFLENLRRGVHWGGI